MFSIMCVCIICVYYNISMYIIETDFENEKLSEFQYDELNKEFNHMYNAELVKNKKIIDKTNLNCMYII